MKNAFFGGAILWISTAGNAISQEARPWQLDAKLDELPVVEELPNLMRFADGRLVEDHEQWAERRVELKLLLQHFVYGYLPDKQPKVMITEVVEKQLPDVRAHETRATLVIGSEPELRMRIAIYKPDRSGPLPVIIREEHALGHLQEVPKIVDRGYLFVEFAREDLDPDKSDIVGPAEQAYPDADWATLAIWAWGAMRVVDYLQTREDVDQEKIGIVGHSRGGKMALVAGALDERFTLVVANGSGCGGAGCFRSQPEGVETLDLITQPERFGYWFHPRLRQFVGREKQLPVDHHSLKALVAPRALICTDARGDLWANPAGNVKTSRAADPLFKWLGAEDNNALHFRDGNHDLLEEDWDAILDFADWRFDGKEPARPRRFFSHREETSAQVIDE